MTFLLLLLTSLAINGYIFGFPLNISMAVGDNIAWYIIVVGGGADVHSINFHGHTVTEKTEVIKNLDSVATLPGEILLFCEKSLSLPFGVAFEVKGAYPPN